MKVKYLLSLLQIVVLIPPIAPLKNLTDIHYRFTTCGSTGYNGPSFTTCMNVYLSNNSAVVHPPNLLFEFGDDVYEGSQGFRVPKSGLFNITVAGAAGGRGICSIDSGKGLIWRGQVNLTEEDNLLILVGQKGVGPCDVQHDIELPLCQDPPTSIKDVKQCHIEWYSWIRNHSALSDLPSQNDDLNLAFIGAGGGGGASMVWRQNRTDGVFDVYPLVIAGGGGGSASNLSYDAIQDIFPRSPGSNVQNVDNETLYHTFINAKATTHDVRLALDPGGRGFVVDTLANADIRAGVGGGWSSLVSQMADTDGEPLSVKHNFAHGGFDCSRQIDNHPDQSAVIRFVQGGFGGGGGQCGVGGAGGGYTGGSIFGNSIKFPGGGGYSYFYSNDSSEKISITSEGDGYVDLVLSDCGCAGSCEIIDHTFECACPSDTYLAPDEFDCYHTQVLQVREGPLATVSVNEIEFNIRVLSFNRRVDLYSIDIQLSVHGENEVCLIFLMGDDSDIAVASNVVRETERAVMLGEVNISPSGTVSLSYDDTLNTPVLVSEVLLVSTGNCSAEGMVFRANISIQDPGGLYGTLLSTQPQNESEVANLAQEIFASDALLYATPSPSPSLSAGEIAGIIIAALVTFVGILFLILVVIAFTYTAVKRRKKVDWQEEFSMETSIPYHNGIVTSVRSEQVSGLPDEIFIKSDQIKLGKIIGEGEFGSVYKAKMYQNTHDPPQIVAVKTLKGFFNPQHIEDLLKESKRMFHLNHPNVQPMIGVCIDGGPIPFVVMPYMQNGSLLSFLRKNKDTLLLTQGEEDEVIAVTQRLTEMCLQIAKGMEYLASQNIVHRDLAARNCMIDDQQCICVADFGLSESMYCKTYFRQDNFTTIRLPLKWLAPESFNTGVFSEKTDVWSFGVTCWEVFNGGRIPYPGITAQSLPKLINRGHRMDKPDNLACIDAMYDVMQKCWLPKSEDRPSFTSLVGRIGAELEAMSEYLPLLMTTNLGHNIIIDQEQEIPRVQNLYQ